MKRTPPPPPPPPPPPALASSLPSATTTTTTSTTTTTTTTTSTIASRTSQALVEERIREKQQRFGLGVAPTTTTRRGESTTTTEAGHDPPFHVTPPFSSSPLLLPPPSSSLSPPSQQQQPQQQHQHQHQQLLQEPTTTTTTTTFDLLDAHVQTASLPNPTTTTTTTGAAADDGTGRILAVVVEDAVAVKKYVEEEEEEEEEEEVDVEEARGQDSNDDDNGNNDDEDDDKAPWWRRRQQQQSRQRIVVLVVVVGLVLLIVLVSLVVRNNNDKDTPTLSLSPTAAPPPPAPFVCTLCPLGQVWDPQLENVTAFASASEQWTCGELATLLPSKSMTRQACTAWQVRGKSTCACSALPQEEEEEEEAVECQLCPLKGQVVDPAKQEVLALQSASEQLTCRELANLLPQTRQSPQACQAWHLTGLSTCNCTMPPPTPEEAPPTCQLCPLKGQVVDPAKENVTAFATNLENVTCRELEQLVPLLPVTTPDACLAWHLTGETTCHCTFAPEETEEEEEEDSVVTCQLCPLEGQVVDPAKENVTAFATDLENVTCRELEALVPQLPVTTPQACLAWHLTGETTCHCGFAPEEEEKEEEAAVTCQLCPLEGQVVDPAQENVTAFATDLENVTCRELEQLVPQLPVTTPQACLAWHLTGETTCHCTILK